ncbi:MAG: hypothetical protein R3C49_06620 [Planctomycetaceae bacterium]
MSVTVTQTVDSAGRRAEELREIPFQVISRSSSKLRAVPLTAGVCLPKGRLFDAGEWAVEGLGGSHLTAQTEILNRFSDGSVRWLLVNFVASRLLPGTTSCCLVRHRRHTSPTGCDVTGTGGRSGVLRLSITDGAKRSDLLLDPELTNADGNRIELRLKSTTRRSAGPVRHVHLVELQPVRLPHVALRLLVEAWPEADCLKVECRIRNTRRARHVGGLWDLGDSGSFHFNSLHLNFRCPDPADADIKWQTDPLSAVQQDPAIAEVRLTQFGSGEEHWNSTNHVDRSGRSTVRYRGYEQLTVRPGVDDGEAVRVFIKGDRCQPVISVSGDDGQLTVVMPEFREQFPSSLGAFRNRAHRTATVCAGCFPESADQTFELQGGEQKTKTAWVSLSRPETSSDHLLFCVECPRILQSSEWIRQCQVLPWFPGSGADGDLSEHSTTIDRFQAYLKEATSGDFSVEARRRKIDEYGWRNFGEVPADHEQTHFAGDRTIISHYNNQFDLIFGGILNLFRTGDPEWFNLIDPLARHVMDIDIYHTNQDRSAFNGGLFWHTDHYVDAHTATHRTYSRQNATGQSAYGGGPANEHNYTTGLLHFYFLTGSLEARETVIGLADWVIAMDDGSRTVFGILDSGCTGLASKTVLEDFHGPGRGVGNSINSLIDGWVLTGEQSYMQKAEELIRRAVHPRQDLDDLHLEDAEGHWSYTVCLTALGRYLSVKLEAGQMDSMYSYVRDTLIHYGRWMVQAEKPTLSQPERLEFPTEAWAAQDLRKANVLRITASCTDNTDDELQMRRKADEISSAAWHDLYQFGQQHLTARCLSIVMTEGLREVFHVCCQAEYFPPATAKSEYGEWSMFVNQKDRVRRLLKNPVRLMRCSRHLLNPVRWVKLLDAFRRQL